MSTAAFSDHPLWLGKIFAGRSLLTEGSNGAMPGPETLYERQFRPPDAAKI
jgi:hypothetical protein